VPILSLAGVKAKPAVCDFLGLTFPREISADVGEALAFHLATAQAHSVCPGLWHLLPPVMSSADAIAWMKKPGTVKTGSAGPVMTLGISGIACMALRDTGVWPALLADLAAFPHRVTRLDINRDYEVDAPPLVAAVADAGFAGGLRLGRKSLSPTEVDTSLGLDARGVMSGTCYLGKTGREIRCKVYDKRKEREDRGFTDPGPLLRVELSLAKISASLRDALDPAPLFHHYSHAVVPCPADVPTWQAAGEGYFLEPRKERDYWQAVQRGVDGISRHLKDLAALADRMGLYGRRMLLGLIANQLEVAMPALPPLPAPVRLSEAA
jgi:hypothetical protein